MSVSSTTSSPISRPTTTATAAQTTLLPRIVLVTLIVGHLVASIYWVLINITPYGRDAGGHLTRALQHAEILRTITWQTLFQAITFHDFRPPALYLAAQIPYRLFGLSMDSAQWTNVFFLGVILLFTYLLARRMMSEPWAVATTALAGFIPMLAAMARTFYLDAFLTAALLIIFYTMLKSDGFTRKRWVVAWGIAIGVGMLVKWSMPAHLLLPVLFYIGRSGLVSQQIAAFRRPTIAWKQMGIATVLAIIVAAVWYYPNRDYALTLPLGDGLWLFWTLWLIPTFYLLMRPSSPVTNFWAAFFVAVAVASLWYVARIDFLSELTNTAFGDYEGRFDTANTQYNVFTFQNITRYPIYLMTRQLGWLCGLLILPLAGIVWLRRTGGWRQARVESWIVWLCILSTYLLLLLTPRETNARNLVPLLPFFAILFVDAVRDIPRRWQPAVVGVWLVALAVHWSVYTFDALDGFYNQTKAAWADSELLQRPNSGSTAAGFWIGPDVLATVNASYDATIQPKTIFGMLINSPEIHRGPYNYLIRMDYPNLDLLELTERFPDMWTKTIQSEWVLSKDGDNHDLDEPGLRVVDEVYNQPEGIFPLLYDKVKEYPLPNGETATLWRRTIGQTYLPQPKESLKPLAEQLTAWLTDDTPLILSQADQAVDLGVLDLSPHRVSVMSDGLPQDANTLFVLLHRGEPSDAAVWEQLQNNYVMAWDGWFDSEYLTVWGRVSDQRAEGANGIAFGDTQLTQSVHDRAVLQGEVVTAALDWQVGATPLKASFRLLNANGDVIAQLDRDIVPSQQFGLFVPPATPPSNYTLAVTVYDPATFATIPSDAGENQVTLGVVVVTE